MVVLSTLTSDLLIQDFFNLKKGMDRKNKQTDIIIKVFWLNQISNLVFYAQSTSMVISGQGLNQTGGWNMYMHYGKYQIFCKAG